MPIFCLISDTHGAKFHSKLQIPECDVLLHAGDIGGRTTLLELTEFLIWFEKQPAKKKIFIAGNHDIILDPEWVERQKKDKMLWLMAEHQHNEALDVITRYNATYLNNSSCIYNGIKIFGSPYTPSFHRQYWAFNADRGEEIQNHWKKIPLDTDILITHGPSNNKLGKTIGGIMAGCQDLTDKIMEIQMPVHLCGHIHEGYGNEMIGNTFSVNASVLNEHYNLVNKPVMFEMDEKTKKIKLLN